MLLVSLTAFSSVSINAAAALSGGKYLTPSETVAILGNSLEITYYDGSDYQTTTAVYVGADVAGGVDTMYQQTDYLQSGLATIIYKFSGSVVNDPNYISVDFSPLFALLDVDQVHTVLGITATGSDISTSPWSTPQWIWTCAGERTVFSGRADYGLHYRCQLSDTFAHGELYDYIPVDWVHQGSTSAFSQRAVFSYAQPAQDGFYYLSFGCPYISDLGSIDTISGTTGTTSSGSTGTVIVNVDMEETNTLLGGIADILSGIVDGVKGLFIPSQNALSTFVNAVDTLLHETFGIFYDNETLIHSALTQLLTGSAQESIYFEGFTMSLAGTSFTFPSFNVPLKPDNAHMSLLYTALASAIDIVCTLAFINMLKHKIWAVFMGEKIVEVEELEDAD